MDKEGDVICFWLILWRPIGQFHARRPTAHSVRQHIDFDKAFFTSYNSNGITYRLGDRGGTVVKVLYYKSEGRWFDSRWCHWNFSWT